MIKNIYMHFNDLISQEWFFNLFLISLTSLIIIIGILLSDEIVMTFWRGYVIKVENGNFIGLSHSGKVLFTAKEDKRRRKYVVDCPKLNFKEPVAGVSETIFEIKELVDIRLNYHKGIIFRTTGCLLFFSFIVWTIVFGRDGLGLFFFFIESILLVEAELYQERKKGEK